MSKPRQFRSIQRAVAPDTPREELEAAVTAVHVTRKGDGWVVARFVDGGSERLFENREEAMIYARNLSLEYRVEVVIHDHGKVIRETPGPSSFPTAATG